VTQRAAIAAAALGLGVVVAGCSDDGRELVEPSAEQTTTLATTSTTGPSVAPMAFGSSAFAAGAAIPARFTCDGETVSPPLAGSDVPADAAALGVVVTDPDANGFVHWVVAGIDPTTAGGVDAGSLPAGAVEGRNDAGGLGWVGPCPPSGTHTYEFTLYALGQPVDLDPDAAPLDAAASIQEAAIATASFSATYQRP
jgi:Raf kinase inhibitor-like YbhB/YbcL family protein